LKGWQEDNDNGNDNNYFGRGGCNFVLFVVVIVVVVVVVIGFDPSGQVSSTIPWWMRSYCSWRWQQPSGQNPAEAFIIMSLLTGSSTHQFFEPLGGGGNKRWKPYCKA
jgi:hypothetical protein